MPGEPNSTQGSRHEAVRKCMPSGFSRLVECLVIAWLLVGFLCIPAAVAAAWLLSMNDFREVLTLLTWQRPVLPVLAIAAGLTLLVWLFVGRSSESHVWKWLPPFALIPLDTRFQREAFVFLLALPPLIGGIGILAGVIKPDWQ